MGVSYRIETQMFLMPSLITMSIAATRMYRSLADLRCPTDVYGILSPYSLPVLTLIGVIVAQWTQKPPLDQIA
jgi:hypothetical protein